MADTVDIGYVAELTRPYWPLISRKIVHITNEYPTYFLFTKKVRRKPSHATTNCLN
jgi:hypothetical protein